MTGLEKFQIINTDGELSVLDIDEVSREIRINICSFR